MAKKWTKTRQRQDQIILIQNGRTPQQQDHWLQNIISASRIQIETQRLNTRRDTNVGNIEQLKTGEAIGNDNSKDNNSLGTKYLYR